MRKPCNDCPFLKGTKYFFTEERSKEILHAITHDRLFHCHKTVDYSSNQPSTESAIFCTGSAIFLENAIAGGWRSNMMYRLAVQCGGINPDDIVQSNEVYDNSADFINENTI
jgi:hypothetical protein